MAVFKKIMALALALTLTLSMGAMTAFAVSSDDLVFAPGGDTYTMPSKETIAAYFTLSRAPGASSTFKVYNALGASGVELPDASVVFAPGTSNLELKLTLPTAPTEDVEYAISVTEPGKDESGRNPVKIIAFTGTNPPASAVTGVTVTPTTGSIAIGASLQLTEEVTVTGTAAKTVEWTSSDNKIATVDANGLVVGVAKGAATITVTSTVNEGKSATAEIKVTEETDPTDPVDPVDPDAADKAAVAAAKTTVLAGKYDVAQKDVNTASEAKTAVDAVVATMDLKDVTAVVAIKDFKPAVAGTAQNKNGTAGSFTVSFTLSKGNVTDTTATATAVVTATPYTEEPVDPADPAVISVTVAPKTASVLVGSSVTLKATVEVKNGAGTDVLWSTSNGAVATVKGGVVTGVAKGTVTITATSATDETVYGTATVEVVSKGGGGSTGGSSGGGTPPSQNTANNPETANKVNDVVAALKDPTKALPADAVKTTTAGGASITTIPLKLTSGNAALGTDIFNTIGGATASVGLKLTVSSSVGGSSAEIIIPGGFGKITEPGRFSFPMDYEVKAASEDIMLKTVKGENAVSMTAKVGGNFTLPVSATVTVPTKLANGSAVNIYKYDPITNKMVVIGKATVKDGKITFATKMMGELLFTTGTV